MNDAIDVEKRREDVLEDGPVTINVVYMSCLHEASVRSRRQNLRGMM